jgi:hypothetical protein
MVRVKPCFWTNWSLRLLSSLGATLTRHLGNKESDELFAGSVAVEVRLPRAFAQELSFDVVSLRPELLYHIVDALFAVKEGVACQVLWDAGSRCMPTGQAAMPVSQLVIRVNVYVAKVELQTPQVLRKFIFDFRRWFNGV